VRCVHGRRLSASRLLAEKPIAIDLNGMDDAWQSTY
jgi:hypothetical protein